MIQIIVYSTRQIQRSLQKLPRVIKRTTKSCCYQNREANILEFKTGEFFCCCFVLRCEETSTMTCPESHRYSVTELEIHFQPCLFHQMKTVSQRVSVGEKIIKSPRAYHRNLKISEFDMRKKC